MEAERRAIYDDLLTRSDRLDNDDRTRLRRAIDNARRHDEERAGLERQIDNLQHRNDGVKDDLNNALGQLAAEKEDIVGRLRSTADQLDDIGSDDTTNTTTKNNLRETADRIEADVAELQNIN